MATILLALTLLHAAPRVGEPTAARWLRELRDADALLRAERFEEAYEASRGLLGELVTALKGGGEANDLVAAALVQQAVAEAGLGQSGDAAWHLGLAEIFNPAFREASLEDFGAAGESLEQARRRRTAEAPREEESISLTPLAGLVPPRILDSPHIVFRASLEVLGALDPQLRVAFVVDRSGRVSRPRVEGRLDNPAPVLLSLEVLRSWRFAPAMLHGEPVPARYSLDLPLTEGVALRARWDLRLGETACQLAGGSWLAAETGARLLLEDLEAAAPSGDREAARRQAEAYLAEAERRRDADRP